ncbi:MAG: PKD domain-containing protein, partial [Thermoplasmata archaeon]|nr:PKD domain-containing protein [Thermoplasmata archaeon]
MTRRLLMTLTVMTIAMMWTSALLPGAASGPWTGGDVGPASPGPDLNASSTDLTLSDPSPRHSQAVTVQLDIRNTGDQDATIFDVELYDGDSSTGTLIKAFNVSSLAAASSTTISIPWTATIGDHDLTMYLDASDLVTEDSEINNVGSLSVTVGGVPDVRLEPGAFILSSNQEGSVTITTDVFNGGNATATGTEVGFYSGDPDSGGSLIGRQALADIPAGGRASAQQSWSSTEGLYQLFARVEGTDVLDPSGNDKVGREVWIASDLTARAGPDVAAFAGQNITFNGSASFSTSGSIVNFTWDLGDGTTLYGPEVTHNYTNTGTTVRTLTANLTIKDGSGGTDTDTARVYVNPLGSSPPTADAGIAPSGRTREALTFNASTSTGTITSYIWDWGDGSGGTGVNTTHTYLDDGVYSVSLAVVSSDSLADVDVIQVTVSNRVPVVDGISDISTDVGIAHALLVLAYDDDGYIASYLWDFGDGSSSTSRDPTHTWTSDGPHQASVNVTDDDGASTIVTFWVNVTDVAPVASFSVDAFSYEGLTVTVDGTSTSEPGNDIVMWEWDWESDSTVDNTTGPMSETVYGSPGYYNITLKVTDGEGSTNETVREVLIIDIVPTADCDLSDTTVDEGMEVTFDASGSSEPGDDIVRYYFDWDGDSIYDYDTTEPIVDHTYMRVGLFYPVLMVEDEDGSFDTYSSYWFMRIVVSNLPPLVNASESYGIEGENINVTVDAYEPGNNLANFSWDFDGDYQADAHSNVPYINHTWWEAGIFWVWVNVTDEDHTDTNPSWGGGEIKVNVTDVGPKPSVEGGQATEGEPTAFTVTMRGTEENISSFQYDLDGDGQFEVNSNEWTTMLIFTKTGEIECLIRVVDTDGTEGIALFNVIVHDVAPTVTGPAFLLTEEGYPLAVEVTAEEPGDDIVRYEFDWNADGIVDDTSTEPMATHLFNSPGAKRVVVTAIDEDGSSGSVGIQVLVANTPPVADAGTPSQSFEGDPIELNASGSMEPGGHIIMYDWDYDADGIFDFSTREVSHNFTWESPGVYTIVLRVMDADGTFDEDTANVVVENAEPVAAIDVTMMPEDRPSYLDATGSTDPGGIALYEWNISAPGQRLDVATTDPIITFTFDRRVRYDITLTVTDGEGSAVKVEYVVALDDVITLEPTVTWETVNLVMEGSEFSLRAWAEDPFPDDPVLEAIRMMEFSWDLGDGSIVKKGDSITHSYDRAAAQPYEVWLTVIDEDNDRVTVMAANISVLNPPPVIEPVTPIDVKAGKKGQTTIEALDGTTPQGELVYHLDPYAPDWVTLDDNILKAEPGKGVDGRTYLVTVTVVDGLGASSQTQIPVVVVSEEVEPGIGWGDLLGLLAVFLIVAIVVAVLVSTRMRPGATKDIPPKDKDYDDLYGEEPRRRKVRPVAKVASERIDLGVPSEEPSVAVEPPAPDYGAPAAVPEYAIPAAPEPEPEAEPPLPSWMTPTK